MLIDLTGVDASEMLFTYLVAYWLLTDSGGYE